MRPGVARPGVVGVWTPAAPWSARPGGLGCHGGLPTNRGGGCVGGLVGLLVN